MLVSLENSMEKRYTISSRWKVILYIIITCFASSAMYMLYDSVSHPLHIQGVMCAIAIIALVVTFYFFVETKNWAIIVSDYSIIEIKTFSKAEIPVKDIKGYRMNDRVIMIIPRNRLYNKIIINSYNFINSYQELISTLRERFVNLDGTD